MLKFHITIIKFLSRFNYHPIFISAVVVLTVFAVDVFIRQNYLSHDLGNKDLFFYFFSAVLEFFFLTVLFNSRFKNYVVIPIFILYIFLIAGSYGFYTFFNTLPGINTFSFMFLTPQNSYSLFIDSLTFTNVTLILLTIFLTCIGVIRLRKKVMHVGTKAKILFIILLVIFALVLNNNTRLADNRTLPFSNAIFSLLHGYKASQLKSSLTKLGYRTYQSKKAVKQHKADYNVLFVMSESINPFLLTEYGYSEQFMPKTSEFLKKNDAVIFKKMFANATITAVSVPFAFAGLNPIEGREKLQSTPMIYDLIKENISNMKTALISSWSYDDYPKFKDFFASENLDYFIYREKLEAEKVCDMGGDDSLIAICFQKLITELKGEERFFSFLHFSNTHYPYFSKTKLTRNLPTEVSNSYANSLTTFDENLSSVFSVLEKSNQLKNTIIVFTSDHSEQLGLFGDKFGHYGKFTIWNCVVPAWCIFPKASLDSVTLTNLKTNCDGSTSNNDLIPTICDLLGLSFDTSHGNSLLKPLRNKRKIFVYNGIGENRTDNKDYLGIICGTDFFVATQSAGRITNNIYDINDREQLKDIFSRSNLNKEFSELAAKILQPTYK